jgi:hypothetical protein
MDPTLAVLPSSSSSASSSHSPRPPPPSTADSHTTEPASLSDGAGLLALPPWLASRASAGELSISKTLPPCSSWQPPDESRLRIPRSDSELNASVRESGQQDPPGRSEPGWRDDPLDRFWRRQSRAITQTVQANRPRTKHFSFAEDGTAQNSLRDSGHPSLLELSLPAPEAKRLKRARRWIRARTTAQSTQPRDLSDSDVWGGAESSASSEGFDRVRFSQAQSEDSDHDLFSGAKSSVWAQMKPILMPPPVMEDLAPLIELIEESAPIDDIRAEWERGGWGSSSLRLRLLHLPASSGSHPLLHAVHRLHIDAVRFLLLDPSAQLNPDTPGTVFPYSGDQLMAQEGDGRNITPRQLRELLALRTATEGRNSRWQRRLRQIRDLITEADALPRDPGPTSSLLRLSAGPSHTAKVSTRKPRPQPLTKRLRLWEASTVTLAWPELEHQALQAARRPKKASQRRQHQSEPRTDQFNPFSQEGHESESSNSNPPPKRLRPAHEFQHDASTDSEDSEPNSQRSASSNEGFSFREASERRERLRQRLLEAESAFVEARPNDAQEDTDDPDEPRPLKQQRPPRTQNDRQPRRSAKRRRSSDSSDSLEFVDREATTKRREGSASNPRRSSKPTAPRQANSKPKRAQPEEHELSLFQQCRAAAAHWLASDATTPVPAPITSAWMATAILEEHEHEEPLPHGKLVEGLRQRLAEHGGISQWKAERGSDEEPGADLEIVEDEAPVPDSPTSSLRRLSGLGKSVVTELIGQASPARDACVWLKPSFRDPLAKALNERSDLPIPSEDLEEAVVVPEGSVPARVLASFHRPWAGVLRNDVAGFCLPTRWVGDDAAVALPAGESVEFESLREPRSLGRESFRTAVALEASSLRILFGDRRSDRQLRSRALLASWKSGGIARTASSELASVLDSILESVTACELALSRVEPEIAASAVSPDVQLHVVVPSMRELQRVAGCCKGVCARVTDLVHRELLLAGGAPLRVALLEDAPWLAACSTVGIVGLCIAARRLEDMSSRARSCCGAWHALAVSKGSTCPPLVVAADQVRRVRDAVSGLWEGLCSPAARWLAMLLVDGGGGSVSRLPATVVPHVLSLWRLAGVSRVFVPEDIARCRFPSRVLALAGAGAFDGWGSVVQLVCSEASVPSAVFHASFLSDLFGAMAWELARCCHACDAGAVMGAVAARLLPWTLAGSFWDRVIPRGGCGAVERWRSWAGREGVVVECDRVAAAVSLGLVGCHRGRTVLCGDSPVLDTRVPAQELPPMLAGLMWWERAAHRVSVSVGDCLVGSEATEAALTPLFRSLVLSLRSDQVPAGVWDVYPSVSSGSVDGTVVACVDALRTGTLSELVPCGAVADLTLALRRFPLSRGVTDCVLRVISQLTREESLTVGLPWDWRHFSSDAPALCDWNIHPMFVGGIAREGSKLHPVALCVLQAACYSAFFPIERRALARDVCRSLRGGLMQLQRRLGGLIERCGGAPGPLVSWIWVLCRLVCAFQLVSDAFQTEGESPDWKTTLRVLQTGGAIVSRLCRTLVEHRSVAACDWSSSSIEAPRKALVVGREEAAASGTERLGREEVNRRRHERVVALQQVLRAENPLQEGVSQWSWAMDVAAAAHAGVDESDATSESLLRAVSLSRNLRGIVLERARGVLERQFQLELCCALTGAECLLRAVRSSLCVALCTDSASFREPPRHVTSEGWIRTTAFGPDNSLRAVAVTGWPRLRGVLSVMEGASDALESALCCVGHASRSSEALGLGSRALESVASALVVSSLSLIQGLAVVESAAPAVRASASVDEESALLALLAEEERAHGPIAELHAIGHEWCDATHSVMRVCGRCVDRWLSLRDSEGVSDSVAGQCACVVHEATSLTERLSDVHREVEGELLHVIEQGTASLKGGAELVVGGDEEVAGKAMCSVMHWARMAVLSGRLSPVQVLRTLLPDPLVPETTSPVGICALCGVSSTSKSELGLVLSGVVVLAVLGLGSTPAVSWTLADQRRLLHGAVLLELVLLESGTRGVGRALLEASVACSAGGVRVSPEQEMLELCSRDDTKDGIVASVLKCWAQLERGLPEAGRASMARWVKSVVSVPASLRGLRGFARVSDALRHVKFKSV